MKLHKILPWIPVFGAGYAFNCWYNDVNPEDIGLYDFADGLLLGTYQGFWLMFLGTISLWIN